MMWKFNQYTDNIAIINEDGSKITYCELEHEGEKLAKVIGQRCLVFVLCRNDKGSLLGYTALLNHKIVSLMLNADIDRIMLDNLLDSYKPDYIWVPNVMSSEFNECESVIKIWDYSLIKTSHYKEFHIYDDLALLLTTSGSTGSPKFVRQSYKNIKSNTESIVSYLELDADERPITTMPMSYTYGLSIINSHLMVGASIIFTQKTLMEKEFWTVFKEYEATSFGGVPYIYEMLDKLRFFRMDLPSLQTMTQAGGKLSPELHRKFAEYAGEKNKKFIVMYGQTEATARMSYLPAEKSIDKYGSMGIAIPGGEFSLIDENGNDINKNDVVGELVYKGDNVTLGYAECGSDLKKGDEFSGVLVTGDMAKRDSDGFYYITGRKKRFLKIFGNRVNLDESERMIKTKFNIECACSGVDDKMSVFITKNALKKDIKDYFSTKTGLHFSAFEIYVISEIPKNEAGKTLYSALESNND